MTGGNVRPRIRPLDDATFRELLSPSLDALCENVGRIEVADTIECDPKTVSNARYERATLGGPSTFNLLLLDPTALNGLAAHYGMTLVPIDGEDDEDDAAYAEIIDGALEVVTEGMKNGRLGRLCHRGKAAVLKAVDKLAAARARVRGRRA